MIDLHRRILDARREGSKRDPLARTRMLLQIHDELVFEAPADDAEAAARVITERMQSAMSLSVPLEVEAGIAENWYESK